MGFGAPYITVFGSNSDIIPANAIAADALVPHITKPSATTALILYMVNKSLLLAGTILISHDNSVLRNYRKCKYVYMFLEINSAPDGLKIELVPSCFALKLELVPSCLRAKFCRDLGCHVSGILENRCPSAKGLSSPGTIP